MSSATEEAAAASLALKKGSTFKKRQEDAKKKQTGELPPDLDQDGKMINPHNPDFITKVPWYLGESGPTLKHHNVQKADHFLSMSETDSLLQNKFTAKKQELATKATGYRKGACKNCGALTHTEKDCVERPRSSKKSAWKSGLDIAPDEVSINLADHGKISYDAKRDQWQGYNPSEYQKTIDKYQRIEAERRKVKQEQKEKKRREEEARQQKKKEDKEKKLISKLLPGTKEKKVPDGEDSDDHDQHDKTTESDSASDSDSDSGSDYDSDEDDDDEENDNKEFIAKDEEARDFQGRMSRQGGIGGAEMKTTVRNLRIREDTPKYLRNLDLNSAFYDPKARAMRSNPLPDENPDDLAFAGDNFIRHSGDSLALAANQVLCWEMQARGETIDVISNPSQAELIHKQFREKKKDLEKSKKEAIFTKYGVTDTQTKGLDPRLRLGQTEVYTEYTRDGKVLKGPAKPIARTKYEEDVFINNHTAVWGSYFNKFRFSWGFACCHSLIRNSYCVGKAGIQINDASNNQTIDAFQERKMLDKMLPHTQRNANTLVKRSDIYGESSSSVVLDDDKIKLALKRAEEQKVAAMNLAEQEERKRSYNSMQSVDVTPEDMEAYRLTKVKRDDPMAALLDSEELLEYN